MGFMGMNMATNAAGNMMNAVNGSTTGQGVYNPNPAQPEMGTIFASAPQTPVQNEAPAQETAPAEATSDTPVEETPAVAPEGTGEIECPNCHEKVTGKFCSNCGTKLE